MAGKWISGKILTWEEEERMRDESLLDGYKRELQELLSEPLPTDSAKVVERGKKTADLLQLITDSQSLHELKQTDVIKILHESFFSIAYKQGVEEGRRQVAQTNTKCEVCAERRRRNREAAAAARKRARGEDEDESDETDSLSGFIKK
jgi:hypothetical protein